MRIGGTLLKIILVYSNGQKRNHYLASGVSLLILRFSEIFICFKTYRMPDAVSLSTVVNKTSVNIFIASSNEVKDERDKCILIVYLVNQAFPSLELKPVMWEYSMVRRNYPEYRNFQHAINSRLEQCELAVFIFYSKIGDYTKEEFDFAQQKNTHSFIFFKQGFTPQTDTEKKGYEQVIAFKNSLDNVTVPVDYNNLTEFEYDFYKNLNLYLAEEYSQMKPLLLTIQELQETVEKQEKIKKELQEQLSSQMESNALKAQALEDIKRGDYEAAKQHIREGGAASRADAAASYFEEGKIAQLELHYPEALELFELAAKLDPSNALYMLLCGNMAHELGHYKKAATYYEQSLKIEEQERDAFHTNLAIIHNGLGNIYRSLRKFNEAQSHLVKALHIYQENYGKDHADCATVLNNMGMLYEDAGKLDEALNFYLDALEINQQCVLKDDPAIATNCNNIANIYSRVSQYDRALQYYSIALKIDLKRYGKDHPKVAKRLMNMGPIYQFKGEYDNAIDLGVSAYKILKDTYGIHHPDVATALNNLGLSYSGKGDYGNAISAYKDAIEIETEFYPADHPNIASEYFGLGSCYFNMTKYQPAIDYFNAALDIYRKHYPENYPPIKNCQSWLDDALAAEEQSEP